MSELGEASDPLTRFSDRVGDYVRHRPDYPPALVDFLRSRAGLEPGAVVADIGSGTGIFTARLLEAGASVFAIEPNDAMRAAAEDALAGRPGFTSLKATAEATGLPGGCVGLVTCAQSFHWFEAASARREFKRILVPAGFCALIWNTLVLRSELSRGYEDIKLRYGTDFRKVRHEGIGESGRLDAFFGPGAWERAAFPNHQDLDREGLRGRLLSSSFIPKADHPDHAPMLASLDRLFERCQRDGKVRMEYEAELYFGRLS